MIMPNVCQVIVHRHHGHGGSHSSIADSSSKQKEMNKRRTAGQAIKHVKWTVKMNEWGFSPHVFTYRLNCYDVTSLTL